MTNQAPKRRSPSSRARCKEKELGFSVYKMVVRKLSGAETAATSQQMYTSLDILEDTALESRMKK